MPEQIPSSNFPTSRRYGIYVLLVLGLVNTFSFIDRQILAVLLVPIQNEFGVSDEWMGLLTGFAFVLLHILMGFPLAHWADRGSRKNIIAISIAIWSAMTALSGMAKNFWHLFICRMGVGIGEAGASPSCQSLISDYFPPGQRARALAVYGAGIHIGIMFGYLAAGWINQYFGWRLAFIVVGLPGLLLALLVKTTIEEPPRINTAPAVNFGQVMVFLFSKPAFCFLMVGSSLHAFSAYGFANWAPTYLHRVHEMPFSEIGTWLGVLSGVGGMSGALAGGWLADHMGSKDVRWYAYAIAIAALASIPPALVFLFTDDIYFGMIFYFLNIFLVGMYPGGLWALIQGLAMPRMRAMAVAIYLFIANLIGGGIGPWLVGRFSDTFRPEYGDTSIMYSLAIVILVGSIGATIFYMLSSRYLVGSIEAE